MFDLFSFYQWIYQPFKQVDCEVACLFSLSTLEVRGIQGSKTLERQSNPWEGGYGSRGPTWGRSRWRNKKDGELLGGDSSPVVKSNAWPGLSRGEVIPRDELYAKIARSEVFSSWGKDCPNIQMLNAQLLNDAWRERIVIVNAHTHTLNMCVC